MPRIPEDEIERIKATVDLAALVRSRGVELKKHGAKDLIGRCPFHEEASASFVVTPHKRIFHCLGCGAAGNVIQFVERFDGVSFRHAFELLAAGSGFAAPGERRSHSTVPKLEAPIEFAADDAALMRQVCDYYHERLMSAATGAPARAYLKQRGLDDEALLKRFKIGFADRSLGLRLPLKNRKDGAEIRARLERLGLYRETGHEHFNGCIVVPIMDADDNVTEVYGRRLDDGGKSGIKHLYLPGAHVGVFNAGALNEPEVILCEAVLDALTFIAAGFNNATTIYGTEGFTAELFEALKRKKVQRVKLAYDADDAGERAAARDAEKLRAVGIEVYRIKFPWGMDANEYARKVTPAAQSLKLLVNAAAWLGAGVPPSVAATPTSPTVSAALLPPSSKPKVSATSSPVAAAAASPAAPAAPSSKTDVASHVAPAHSSSLAAELAAERRLEARATSGTGVPPVASAAGILPAFTNAAEAAKEDKPSTVGNDAHDQAKPIPAASNASRLVESGEFHTFTIDGREYRLAGLAKNNGVETLKLTLRVRSGERIHSDAIDLCRDLDRRRFTERAAEECALTVEAVKRDLSRLLLACEQWQEARAAAINAPSQDNEPTMTPEEEASALVLLKAPDLLSQFDEAMQLCGLVGERTNGRAAYLAGVSRKLAKPLAVIVQSTSAAGKSTLMDAVLNFFPEDERIKYSAMTGQSLYYLGDANLKHKILAIVEEEGAEKASYALKLLQSEGELTIASTGKDPNTGRMETQEYHVEGPVMIFLTTTTIDIDDELLNRCLVLSVDESNEQTARIHERQRKARTLEGLLEREVRKDVLALWRNAQRLIKSLGVVNPFASALTFTSERTRTRRDHEKYLTLIDSIALLHQHQREVKTRQVNGRAVEFIEVQLSDIETANALAPEILGRSLDELPPQTRRLLNTIRELIKTKMAETKQEQSRIFFSRREVCERCGWSYAQVRTHIERLIDVELIATRAGRHGAVMLYELLMDANATDAEWQIGLIDVSKLKTHHYDPNSDGQKGNFDPPCESGPSESQAA